MPVGADPRPLPASPACSSAAYYASQTVYFVGASDDGFVSVYRGLPYDLPAGLHLYSVNYESGAPVDELTPAQRQTVTTHKLRSKDDAQDLVTPARDRGAGGAMTSARNRELLALVPASLLLTAGFAAVFIERNDVLTNVSLTYGAIFLGLCLAAHVVLRFTLPYADPYLFPLFAVLACFGLVMIYRIDDDARARAGAVVRHRAGRSSPRRSSCCATTACSSATATRSPPSGIGLLLLPRLPGIGSQVNGAYLGVRLGPLTFQPAEFAKIAIIVFLASYLRDTRQLLVIGARRFAGDHASRRSSTSGRCSIVWGAAMVMLFVIQDLGSSLMFFGGFLAVLYVATNRFSFVAVGLALFARRRVGPLPRPPDHHPPRRRVAAPLRRALRPGPAAATRSRSRVFAQADGGLFGRGFGQARAEGRRLAAAARGADRPHLLGDRQRAGPDRRLRGAAAPTCWPSSAASRSPRWRATRSPSCWPRA